MINIFQSQFASDDQSLVFLNQLFGNMNGIIFNPEGHGSTASTLNILSVMFKTFNTVVLGVAALIIVYVTVVSVLSTAHEGEFMGKKYGGIWTPIRMVLGIAALVPTGSGYSAIQMILMWIIVQGIGAADLLWTTVINYVNTVGSPNAQISIPTVGASTAMGQLFQALVCDATSRITAATPGGSSGGGPYYCGPGSSNAACKARSDVLINGNLPLGASAGSCGTLTFCDDSATADCADPNSLTCSVCKGQLNALRAIIPTLTGIATIFANEDYDYRDFYYNSGTSGKPSANADWSWIYSYCSTNNISQGQCCIASKSPFNASSHSCDPNVASFAVNGTSASDASDTSVKGLYWPYGLQAKIGNVNFINTAVSYYISQITDALTSNIAAQPPPAATSDLGKAQSTGWLYAGAYYFVLVSHNQATLTASLPTFAVSGNNPAQSNNVLQNYRNNYQAAATLLSVVNSAASGSNSTNSGGSGAPVTSSGCGLPSAMCPLATPLTSLTNDVTNTFMANIGSNNSNGGSNTIQSNIVGNMNPLVKLGITGRLLLTIGQDSFLAILSVAFLLGSALGINGWVAGFGGVDELYFGATMLWLLLGPVILGLIGLIIFFGGLLGVYVPLIPLVIFTLGSLGWFMSTVEAMVAGPIVALGILSPNSQGHELLGKAEQGLQIIFNIFLRPSLMIFGLIAAMLLSTIIVSIINYGFWSITYPSLPLQPYPLDFFLQIFFLLAVYIALIVVALNKCFQLIAILPERVLAWIGQPGQHGFEAEGLGEVKGGHGEMGRRAETASGQGASAGKEGQAFAMKKGQDKGVNVSAGDDKKGK